MHDNMRYHPLSLAIYGTDTGTAVMKSSRVEWAKNPFEYWLLLALELSTIVLV
jgi:hypothetical protein